jgi:2-polyprenyl-3-methyl-5-hydroxy-6-metoxy-1,4-benzoquinol methylase
MRQTPAHEVHNPDLLSMLPTDSKRLFEIGCSAGALAREYKLINSNCIYTGVEIDHEYAKLAERHCDFVLNLDIETADESFYQLRGQEDCWIFGDVLEHLRDPWQVLSRIRKVIPSNGSVVACIPNAQHWSVQAKLNSGEFRYEESGLLDRTHLRWFTRKTIVELFMLCGFKITNGIPRIIDESDRDKILSIIREMAKVTGADPEMAASDALPLQYVVKAVPS